MVAIRPLYTVRRRPHRSLHRAAAVVDAAYDVGIEHGKEGVEVSIARRGQKGLNDLML